jgi:protein ImuA
LKKIFGFSIENCYYWKRSFVIIRNKANGFTDMKQVADKNIIQRLQNEVLSMQRTHKISANQLPGIGLGEVESAFPDGVFPIGAVHEFVSDSPGDEASTTGFISGVLGKLMQNRGNCIWVSTRRRIFPPSMNIFGVEADRIIFIDCHSEKHALWAVEESLKCNAVSAVVGEIGGLTFSDSRRLQLAVEQSHVTGFVHRSNFSGGNTACAARWKITPIPSLVEAGMPGIGFPVWKVELLKVKNGKTGSWQIGWLSGGFRNIEIKTPAGSKVYTLKTG